MKMRNLFFITVFFLQACAPQHYKIKAYSDENMSVDRLALLKPVGGIVIDSLDKNYAKKATAIADFGPNDIDISLPEGSHEISVSFYDGAHVGNSIVLHFNAKAGHKYLVLPNNEQKHWWSNSATWKPAVVDVMDKEICWTLKPWKVKPEGTCDFLNEK